VFVVADGVVDKRAVILGRRIPGYVVIREGLTAGESVVTEGTGKVRQGSLVESIDQASATNTRPATEG
jgi:membrane fusion protein (multidrug efflux system)